MSNDVENPLKAKLLPSCRITLVKGLEFTFEGKLTPACATDDFKWRTGFALNIKITRAMDYKPTPDEFAEHAGNAIKHYLRSLLLLPPSDCAHEGGIDGAHTNQYCKKCFIDKPKKRMDVPPWVFDDEGTEFSKEK